MERRANLARQALEDGQVDGGLRDRRAGTSAARGADYADAEWVAGFIALTRMDDPARAVGHFARFRAAVATPISLGRAGYWLGRAYEAAGDDEAAARPPTRPAREHQTSFYGQLAADEARPAARPAADRRPAARRTGAGAVHARPRGAGRPTSCISPTTTARAAQFFRHAAEGKPAEMRAALAQMAIDLGRPQIGLRIAKDAAADGIVLPGAILSAAPDRRGRVAGADRVRDGDRPAGVGVRRRAPAATPARAA